MQILIPTTENVEAALQSSCRRRLQLAEATMEDMFRSCVNESIPIPSAIKLLGSKNATADANGFLGFI
jgi:hypothetical protein